MLVAVINKVKAVPNSKGLGVIYWEPEGEKSWSGYQLSCWGADGKPTAALNAFMTNSAGLNMINNPSGFELYPNPCLGRLLNFTFRTPGSHDIRIFDLNGRLMDEQKIIESLGSSIRLDLLPGIYLVNVDFGKSSVVEKLVVL
jgi:hypothetical protein